MENDDLDPTLGLDDWKDPTIDDGDLAKPSKSEEPPAADVPAEGGDAPRPPTDGGDGKPAEGHVEPKPATPPAGPKDQDAGEKPVMVPKARLDQVLAENRALKDNYAYERGRAEALEELTKSGKLPKDGEPADGGGNAPKTPDDPVAAAISTKRQAIIELGKKFEAGDLTAPEMLEQQGRIQDEIDELREQRLISRVQQDRTPQPAAPSLTDRAFYQAHAQKLYADYPAMNVASEADLKRLGAIAIAEAEVDGRPYQKGSPEDALRFREDIAKLSERKLLQWYPDIQIPAKKAGTQLPDPGAKPPVGQKPLSPAAAKRKAELDALNGHPPDLRTMGRSAPSEGVTDSQVVAMDETELERMSAEQLLAIANR